MPPHSPEVFEGVFETIITVGDESASKSGHRTNNTEAQQVKKCASIFKKFYASKEGQEMRDVVDEVVRDTPGTPEKKATAGAEVMYMGFIHSLGNTAKRMAEMADTIIKGIFYTLCYAFAITALIALGIILAVKRVIIAIAVVARDIIEAVTGFVWGMLMSAAESPAVWATVMGFGGGVAMVNPLLGGVIAAVGAVGTAVTC